MLRNKPNERSVRPPTLEKLLIEIRADLNKKWDIPCWEIRRLNIFWILVLPKFISKFNIILTQIPAVFLWKLTSKFKNVFGNVKGHEEDY